MRATRNPNPGRRARVLRALDLAAVILLITGCGQVPGGGWWNGMELPANRPAH